MSNHTPHVVDGEAPSSAAVPAGPSRYSRTTRPVWGALWRTLLSMVALIVFAVVGALTGLQLATMLGAPEWSEVIFGGLGSLTVGVALVVVLRRFVEGDRSISLGAAWERGRALLWLVLGIGVAAVVLGFGIADQFLRGTARVQFADLPAGDLVLGTLSLLAVAFLLQGIPEELLFRGYLQGTLAERLPVWTAVVISGVAFGVLHLVSQGSGDTVSSKLIYVLSATGLGFAAGGLRAVTGSTWAAIGLHGGDHLVTGVSQLWLRMDDEYVSLWSTAVLFAICAICLVIHSRRVKIGTDTAQRPHPDEQHGARARA